MKIESSVLLALVHRIAARAQDAAEAALLEATPRPGQPHEQHFAKEGAKAVHTAALEAGLFGILACPEAGATEFEQTVVKPLARLLKIVDERIPIPVQISPRGVIREACHNRDSRAPVVVAAVAKKIMQPYPGSPDAFAVLGLVDYGEQPTDGSFPYRYSAWFVSATGRLHNYAERGQGDTPARATGDVPGVDVDLLSRLRMVLLDMLDHGETERILP